MLMLMLADGVALVRGTVLRSLFSTNYKSLAHKLGGLLNRRVYTFAFNRDTPLSAANVSAYRQALLECTRGKHVMLTQPEYCLSFKLKAIEMCAHTPAMADKLLDVQRLLARTAKDILDESDEILSAKYQLVYSVGQQSSLDGDALRWRVPQLVLRLVRQSMRTLSRTFAADVEYEAPGASDACAAAAHAFPHVRLLNRKPLADLCRMVCDGFFDANEASNEFKFLKASAQDADHLKAYVLHKELSAETQRQVARLAPRHSMLHSILLVLRGLLACDLLYLVLTKRWCVNYGVNPDVRARHLAQAVPYLAKGVPSERAQFAHADVAILYTCLSYYYAGLSDAELASTFDALERNERGVGGACEYDAWMAAVRAAGGRVDARIATYASVNRADSTVVREHLYPTVRRLPCAIDFYLSTLLFPREMRQSAAKLSVSAWDLCALNANLISGFSGTNDSRFLLPTSMAYHEIPQLLGTSAHVLSSILSQDVDVASQDDYSSSCYTALSSDNGACELSILDQISCCTTLTAPTPATQRRRARVLLDVGALMIQLSNRQVIVEWLARDRSASAGVYFERDDLMVLERGAPSSAPSPFETSPYRARLDECVIYLDDAHTRGTDLRIPRGAHAAVTLGRGLTKDRLAQACMRMRMLADGGHTLCFFASREAHCLIVASKSLAATSTTQTTKAITNKARTRVVDVLAWCIGNTLQQIETDFLYWSVQGLAFLRKQCAMQIYNAPGADDSTPNDEKKLELYECSTEVYAQTLSQLNGGDQRQELISTMVSVRAKSLVSFYRTKRVQFALELAASAQTIVDKVASMVPRVERFNQLHEDQLILEVEKEEEDEEQVCRPPEATPLESRLEKDVQLLVAQRFFNKASASFVSLMKSLEAASIRALAENAAWSKHLYVTRDFTRTVSARAPDDDYLRLPRWIVRVDAGPELFFLSSFEVNQLMPHFEKDSGVDLFMVTARQRQRQSRILNLYGRTLDPLLEEQCLIFCGSLYFQRKSEQSSFLSFTGFCPSPRSKLMDARFHMALIEKNGFVKAQNRDTVFSDQTETTQCQFVNDPSEFISKLSTIRNYRIMPKNAHHLQIFNGCRVDELE